MTESQRAKEGWGQMPKIETGIWMQSVDAETFDVFVVVDGRCVSKSTVKLKDIGRELRYLSYCFVGCKDDAIRLADELF